MLFSLVLAGLSARAQFVVVQDSVLRQCLCDRFPLAFTPSCDSLDTVGAFTQYPSVSSFSLTEKGIFTADEISYFKGIQQVWLNKNGIDLFDPSLNGFSSLRRLNLAENGLSTLPDLFYTNQLAQDTAVKLTYFMRNGLSEYSESWNRSNPYTQVVDMNSNNFDHLPDSIEYYSELRRINYQNNRLTYNELVRFKSNTRWGVANFELFPQQPYRSFDSEDLWPGAHLEIDGGIEGEVNSYYLIRSDGSILDSNSTGLFVFESMSIDDTGSYFVKATNPGFTGADEFIQTDTFAIRFLGDEVLEEDGLITMSPDGDGIGDYLVLDGTGTFEVHDSNGLEIFSGEEPFEWAGQTNSGTTVTPGLYVIQKEDQTILKVLVFY